DDPYVAVRQAQLVDMDIKSDLKEAPSEAEESQPLDSRVPLMSEEFEAFELPVQKRGTSELILDTDSKGDELGEEDTEEDKKDESSDVDDEREGLGYGAARRCALESTEEIALVRNKSSQDLILLRDKYAWRLLWDAGN
ncbi:hypothetical protein Tco_1557366, partial [Tanacetum coccineum]